MNTIVVVMDTTTLVLARLATKMIPLDNDDKADSPKDEDENADQILKWVKETEDLRKLSDDDFKQVANAIGENELMTKALHMLFEDLVTREKKAVRNSMITFRRLLSQAIHIEYGEMTEKVDLSRLLLTLNSCWYMYKGMEGVVNEKDLLADLTKAFFTLMAADD